MPSVAPAPLVEAVAESREAAVTEAVTEEVKDEQGEPPGASLTTTRTTDHADTGTDAAPSITASNSARSQASAQPPVPAVLTASGAALTTGANTAGVEGGRTEGGKTTAARVKARATRKREASTQNSETDVSDARQDPAHTRAGQNDGQQEKKDQSGALGAGDPADLPDPALDGAVDSHVLPASNASDVPALLARALRNDMAREELPFTVRARLAPLLGADVTDVHLYRGADAAEVTTRLGAEALAVGNAVLLSPGQDLNAPRTLGLLAHELTHVARQRDPSFIPAVVRADHAGRATDEERLAAQVEGRVRVQLTPSANSDAASTSRNPAASAAGPSARPAKPWQDGLPAPWEPLPYWDAPAPGTSPAARPVVALPAVPASTSSAAPAAAGLPIVAAPAVPSAPIVQAASVDRSVPPPNEAPPARNEDKPVGVRKEAAQRSPDLDALARQVYDRLKRRLHAEVRRMG